MKNEIIIVFLKDHKPLAVAKEDNITYDSMFDFLDQNTHGEFLNFICDDVQYYVALNTISRITYQTF